ncbi:MAG: hypothetical protein WD266_05785 [Balneolales bacterium]
MKKNHATIKEDDSAECSGDPFGPGKFRSRIAYKFLNVTGPENDRKGEHEGKPELVPKHFNAMAYP